MGMYEDHDDWIFYDIHQLNDVNCQSTHVGDEVKKREQSLEMEEKPREINETASVHDDCRDCEFDTDYMLNSYTYTDQQSDQNRWSIILSSMGLEKQAHELTRTDLIGRVFNLLEDAEYFFNQYARFIGFSVRKGHMRRRTNGVIMLREWKCSCEGKRDEKYLKLVNRKREPRPVTRVGCGVVFRVLNIRQTEKWIVKEFKTDHSHRLAAPTHVRFLRSNRVISGGDLQVARAMKTAGIRTCQIMSFMAQQAGGYENMQYIIKDLYNQIGSSTSIQLSNVDASRAIGYLEHKANHDNGFFGKFSYDTEGRLGNVVWADSRCQSDYRRFGHAIAFDTTYRTNGYGKPLLIWIGINQHFKTTVLGFAILINETVETYKWVTDAFIECMKGVTPKTVMTDGDLAIRAAIADLMPNARHRLCSWHIQRKAVINVKDPDFLPRMKKMVYRYYSEEEFDMEWSKMVRDFGLQNNFWIQQMYGRRKTWAETFLRGHFFVGMSTTQRSEGINALLKKHLTEKLKLWEFVRSIDLSLSWLRDIESKDNFDTYNSKPVLQSTNMKEIEAQAAEVYSRRIFFKVKDEILKEGKYIVELSGEADREVHFQLTKYGQTQFKREVKYVKDKEIYECECNYFPTFGIPCRHIFATMKFQHVKNIPETMIVSQWTMHEKKQLLKEADFAPSCKYTCSEEVARSGVIRKWLNDIAFIAGKSGRHFERAIAEMAKVRGILLNEVDNSIEIMNDKLTLSSTRVEVRNPLCTKTKGTSSMKGGTRAPKRKCSLCNNYGHNKATCKNRG